MIVRRIVLGLVCIAAFTIGACSGGGGGTSTGSSSGGSTGSVGSTTSVATIPGYSGNGTSGGTPIRDATTETAPCKIYDVCSLITVDDVNSLGMFGIAADGGFESTNLFSTQALNGCVYDSFATGANVSIQISCGTRQPDETSDESFYADAGYTIQPVAGFADGALLLTKVTPQQTLKMLHVFVRTLGSEQVNITISVTPPTGTTVDPVAAEVTLAHDLISRL